MVIRIDPKTGKVIRETTPNPPLEEGYVKRLGRSIFGGIESVIDPLSGGQPGPDVTEGIFGPAPQRSTIEQMATDVGGLLPEPVQSILSGEENITSRTIQGVQDLGETATEVGREVVEQRGEALREAGVTQELDQIRGGIEENIGINTADVNQVNEMFDQIGFGQSAPVQKAISDSAAELLGISPDEINKGTVDNAKRLFNLSNDTIDANQKILGEQSERKRQLEQKLQNPDGLSRMEKVSMGLAVALPLVALAMSKNRDSRQAAGQALAMGGQLIDTTLAKSSQQQAQIQQQLDEVRKDIFQSNKGLADQIGKVMGTLDKKSEIIDERIDAQGKLVQERREAKGGVQLGNVNMARTGIRMGGADLFRDASLPKMPTEVLKGITKQVQALPAFNRDMSIMEQILKQKGIQADGSVSGDVTIIDPDTGKEMVVNAAGALQSSYGRFFLAIKNIENLGALGADTERLGEMLLSMPVDYKNFLKDSAGGQTQAALTQIQILTQGKNQDIKNLLDANSIVTESDVTRSLVERGELPGVELVDDSDAPGKIYRVRLGDGRTARMNQASLNLLLKKLRNK